MKVTSLHTCVWQEISGSSAFRPLSIMRQWIIYAVSHVRYVGWFVYDTM